MIIIKSKIDVITNSSSECFSVKGHGSTFEVASKWYKFLEDNYKDECGTIDNPKYNAIYNAKFYEENGKVFVDYTVLCNIDNAYEKMIECFGKENVEDEY